MQSGERVEVDVTAIAHGGHCVARHDGQVIFVRYAIPGERVVVEITDVSKSFARGNCVEVITASPHRITPPCKYAHVGGCGGCDFQHIEVSHQRELKALIIKEQFQRLAKEDVNVEQLLHEIIDLLAGGQGVFGIAVGKVWHEVEGSLSMLSGEIDGHTVGGESNDELSLRRKRKGA